MIAKLRIILIALTLLFSYTALADAGKSKDFPGDSGVFRVREVRGEVWMRPGPGATWEEAYGNMPVTNGYEIATEKDGFADIEVDSETYIRLGGGTAVAISDAGGDMVVFEYTGGSIYVSRLSDQSQIDVVFSSLFFDRIILRNQGAFRIDDTIGGTVTVAVREGWVSLIRFDKEYLIKEKEMALLDEGIRFSMAYGEDSWDALNEKRDNDILAQSSRPRIDFAVAGRYDIDRYGDWLVVPTYGYVWRPRVVLSGWAPFVYGRWVFLSPFGWTWVSLEPWGWITYHYGSWLTISNYGWVWVPSAQYRVWHPSRARMIFEGKRVRWVPLRPGERAVWYRSRLSHRRYVNVINRGAIFSRPALVKKKGNVFREHAPRNRREHRKDGVRREPVVGKRPGNDATGKKRLHGGESKEQIDPVRYRRKIIGKDDLLRKKRPSGAVIRKSKYKLQGEVSDITGNAKMIKSKRGSPAHPFMSPRPGKVGRKSGSGGIVKKQHSDGEREKALITKRQRGKREDRVMTGRQMSGIGIPGKSKR